jgi:hypothetical protein
LQHHVALGFQLVLPASTNLVSVELNGIGQDDRLRRFF